jgi:DNA-directed RNA polymerase I, II, and III subunit RPABC2
MADEDHDAHDIDNMEDVLETFDEIDPASGEVVATDDGSSSIRPELRRLYNQHPELIVDYIETVIPKLSAKGDHRTYPFLTLYEKTKIIGLRANQLSKGARPYIPVPDHISSVRDIARMELEQKRLPFIVKRPMPNGTYEYWRLSDLILL